MGSNYEAERQLLVNVFHGSDTKLKPGELRNESHQIIMKALQDLQDSGIKADLVTLRKRIEKNDSLEHAGGYEYIEELWQRKPNARQHEAYEEIIRDDAIRARVLEHANNIIREEEYGTSTTDLLVMAQTQPMDIGVSESNTTFVAQDVAYDVLDEISERRTSRKLTGVETPWKKVNDLTRGLQKKDLIILAGRPSMGKTAMGGQIATHAAKVEGPVFIGSLEMDSSSLVERMLVGAAKVDNEKVRSGYVSQEEYEKLQIAAERLQDHHPIIINDSSRMTAQDLRMAISQANLKYNGLSLAVIDYLGLLRDDGKNQQRYREIGEATRLMRATAKDIGIPIVLLCQLNRSCEMRENKKPILSDLRESGDIEQDSDVVMMLFREEYYCPDCPGNCQKDHQGVAELLIRKQRKGPTGKALLSWIETWTQFENFGGY